MRDDKHHDTPRILARLRDGLEGGERDRMEAPGWARPVGWVIAAAIVILVVATAAGTNPW